MLKKLSKVKLKERTKNKLRSKLERPRFRTEPEAEAEAVENSEVVESTEAVEARTELEVENLEIEARTGEEAISEEKEEPTEPIEAEDDMKATLIDSSKKKLRRMASKSLKSASLLLTEVVSKAEAASLRVNAAKSALVAKSLLLSKSETSLNIND